jgi:ankyrin repeat protein
MQKGWLYSILLACLSSEILFAQSSQKVDFAADVQPIFRENCVECHGPSQQMRGLRLDRRRSAMPNRVGANGADIVPGKSGESEVYFRLTTKDARLRMPPTGPLKPEQMDIIKRWIDQGAEWPDEFAGEATRQPGAHETKPLLRAALYGDLDTMRRLLEHGADPNLPNSEHATALMYAVDDLEKTRLLLEHGANPNARSDEGMTPLLIAASRAGSSPVVKLLLDHGADAKAKLSNGTGVLTRSAMSGDEGLVRLLLDAVADKRPLPLHLALRSGCLACFDALVPFAEGNDLTRALGVAAELGYGEKVGMLLKGGARARGEMLVDLILSPHAVPVDMVKTLIERGADVNVKSEDGGTVLDLAKLQGETPLVGLLIASGAKGGPPSDRPAVRPKPAASVRAAVERSIPLLQRADGAFLRKAGCVSCHNNSLTAMTRMGARQNRIPVDEDAARTQVQGVANYLDANRERALQGIGVPGWWDSVGYILLGLAEEKYPPDEITDAWARYLKNSQQADGHWFIVGARPPLEVSSIQTTATAMRAIQVYGLKSKRVEYASAVQRAGSWLEKAQPKNTEDLAFQLLGLQWAGGRQEAIRKAAKTLVAAERSDGGWAQLPSLTSDAYATGEVLVALRRAGVLKVNSAAYQRGVQFLLHSQLEDGSWFVQTRTRPIQPAFDSDFPHGRSQFISAAATNWATMALLPCAR